MIKISTQMKLMKFFYLCLFNFLLYILLYYEYKLSNINDIHILNDNLSCEYKETKQQQHNSV